MSRQSSHSLKCISFTSYVLASPGSQSYNLNSSAALPPDVLRSLEEVFSLKCATIRFIPNRAKHAFARALSSSLQRVVSENSLDSWLKLLMLPKCILPSAKRGGRHNKPVPIEALCDLWLKDSFSELWRMARARALPSNRLYHAKDSSSKQQVISAISLAQDGLYGKACQALVSSGVAPYSEETWKLLPTKHPKCEPTAPEFDVSIPSSVNIMAILRSFPKLTAAGPTGLRVQHLIDVADSPIQTAVLSSLKAVVHLLASGRAPSQLSVFLAGGNLAALNKSKPDCPLDVRPIALGETLRRLTGKCLCCSEMQGSRVFSSTSIWCGMPFWHRENCSWAEEMC